MTYRNIAIAAAVACAAFVLFMLLGVAAIAERATGNLERDMPLLRKEADRIRAARSARESVRSSQKNKSNNCREK